MKKSLILIPLIILSCKKEASVTGTQTEKNPDSLIRSEDPYLPLEDSSEARKDSIINNAPATKEVLRTGVMRDIEGNKIIRIADAEQLPFTIGEEFDKDDQEFILKIQNFSNGQISAEVKPENDRQNIRINQIKLPDGSYDGPFGRKIENYRIPENGEVWLIIGKSNMASGETGGSFSVTVQ